MLTERLQQVSKASWGFTRALLNAVNNFPFMESWLKVSSLLFDM